MLSLTDEQIAEVVALVDALSPESSPNDWVLMNEGEHIGCLHYRGKCLGRVAGGDGAATGGGSPEPRIGPAGPEGPMGPAGPMGQQGEAGPQGPQGDKGDKGDIGPQGEIGPIGPAGVDGAQGAPGERGPIGPSGADGAEGPEGPQGIQGPQGVMGPMGIPGPQGIQGDAGATGPTGATGPAGTVALYNQSGLISGVPKIWVGYANPNSSGIWTVNFASAGFTTIPFVMVCSANLGTAPADRNFASVNTLSTTTTTATGGVSNAVTTGLLVATVLTNASTSTPVMIMAIGV